MKRIILTAILALAALSASAGPAGGERCRCACSPSLRSTTGPAARSSDAQIEKFVTGGK